MRQSSKKIDPDRKASAVGAAETFLPLGWKEWAFVVVLMIVVFAVYQPAWQGGLIWDDEAHVTRPELRSWQGLFRIWFEPGASQQYYPLLHSAFWIEHRLWGDATLGYHLTNILQHAIAAVLVALILRRLAVPGAFLAAAIFALHPVHVESVAWITEQKNTLSAVFYLSAALAYLRFDETRNKRFYAAALALFALGLLSKTVTATLPAALLVVFWWKRGTLSWRRDVLPLLPFFILGAAGGIFTAWVEHNLIGAKGAEFEFSFVERCLLAGRVVWFYLGKLFWPINLLFIYPRWQIDQTAAWQYLFPAFLLLTLGVLWWLRARWRGPLAGMLYFVGTLFPVLGFFNVYPFIFSFVADHFQYLASLGIITLASAGIALLLKRFHLWDRPAGYIVCLLPLSTLACLTCLQSRMYTDLETLYRKTLDRNRVCWMAHVNLGIVLDNTGRFVEAIEHYRTALEMKPSLAAIYNNLGAALLHNGQYSEAIVQCRKALEIEPNNVKAHNNLGLALSSSGRNAEAVTHYETALDIMPDYPEAHYNLGNSLFQLGKHADAILHYQELLKLDPDFVDGHNNMGAALAGLRRYDEAIMECRKAIEIKPNYVEAYNNLGSILVDCGRNDEAIVPYRKALEIKPDNVEVLNGLGAALANLGRYSEAAVCFQKALEIKPQFAKARDSLARVRSLQEQLQKSLTLRRERIQAQPDDAGLLNDTAWLLATYPDAGVRNATEAVDLAKKAVELSGGREPAVLDTLAAALASADRFDEAVKTAQKALELASQQNKPAMVESIRARIQLYQAKTPYHALPTK
jgi:protein O-mannosyl-transferase